MTTQADTGHQARKNTGKTQWYPYHMPKMPHVAPVRHGTYECAVRISRAVPPLLWPLKWDGVGFLVPFPMVVLRWRGQTKRAHVQKVAS